MQPILLEIPPPTPTTSWLAIGIGIATIVYVAFIRPLTHKKKDPLSHPQLGPSLARQRSVDRDMSNLLVELSEMARQMTAQLDTRAARLDALIREADEKIAMLRSLGSAGGNSLPQGVLIEAKLLESDAIPMRAIDDAVPVVDPRHAEVYEMADGGHSAQDIAHQTGRPRGEIELILALRGR